MKHLQHKDRLFRTPANEQCKMLPGDITVAAAMQSDCNACRTAAGVAPMNEKSWDGKTFGVKPELSYVPTPHPRADQIMKEALLRRDGRY